MGISKNSENERKVEATRAFSKMLKIALVA